MNVQELIKKLEALDPNAQVVITSSNFELGGANVSLSWLKQYNTGIEKQERFRDAFDGQSYTKKVWDISGGNTPIVYLS
jgi:hypothetical protein